MCRRQMAGAAVLLEEWLQELAALAQVIYKRLYLHEVFILLFVWQHWPTKSANKQMMQLFLLALVFYKLVHKSAPI